MTAETISNFILVTKSCPLVCNFIYQCYFVPVHASNSVHTNNTNIYLLIIFQLQSYAHTEAR